MTPDPTPTGKAAPVLSRLMHGTFWLALKTPVSMITALWSVPLTIRYVGAVSYGDYLFAWNFGFVQALLEFGMGSALQKQMTDAWARGDRAQVDRTIACGMNFYAAVAGVQVAVLLALVGGGLPAEYRANRLVHDLLWVQILTTPFYGISAVVGSALQAAQRYSFLPRLELLIILLRFALLWLGYATGAPFLWVVVAQVTVQIGLSLGPSLYIMARQLGHVPHFGGVRLADFAVIMNVSVYMALLQWSVVLADKVDITMLGFALPGTEKQVSFGIAVYNAVSKPFLTIRQAGWTLAYLVMPAVVSLAVGGDRAGLERIKYDGTRLLVAMLVPPTLLAGIYAAPFLELWVGRDFVPFAGLLRLFLVATLPLVLSAVVQMGIGMGHVKLVALASFVGSLVNLPVSYVLTRQVGVAGVIWGTVLTTLVANLLVPMVALFPRLEVRYGAFLARTLGPPALGGLALLAACGALGLALSPDPAPATPGASGLVPLLHRAGPFLLHLTAGCLAYAAGYAASATGRGDLAALAHRLAAPGRRGAALARKLLGQPPAGPRDGGPAPGKIPAVNPRSARS